MTRAAPSTRTSAATAWLGLALVALAAGAGFHRLRPPAPLPASAPPEVFSAERASAHVRAIAKKPHPLGSDAQNEVRAYLLAELAELGVEPEVQDRMVDVVDAIPVRARVRNVIARLPGTGEGKAVLCMAHYDSVTTAPGASDDAAGVATLLETLRALRAREPLRRDVLFLFTDGEEAGLLGAEAFVEAAREAAEAGAAPPLEETIGLVLNFEARGRSGPSILFETSRADGELVRMVAEADPHPFGTSLGSAVYRRMPNDTDFTVLRRAGIPGLNFAFIFGLDHYHTALDRPENLDPASLQHHGSHALALIARFANRSEEDLKGEPAIFFDLPGDVLVHYPVAWALPIAIALVLAAALLWMRMRPSGRELAAVLLPPVLGGALAFGAARLALAVLASIHGGTRILGTPLEYLVLPLGIGCAALALAVPLCFYSGMRSRWDASSAALGAALLWTFFSVVLAIALPEGSYLTQIPAGFLLVGAAVRAYSRPGAARSGRIELLSAVCAAPAFLLLAPVLVLLTSALALRGYPVLAIPIALLVATLVPFLESLLHRSPWRMPAVPAVLAIPLLGYAAVPFEPDASRPRAQSAAYVLQASSGEASWTVYPPASDPWSRSLLGADPRVEEREHLPVGIGGRVLVAPAPVVPLEPPSWEVVRDETDEHARHILLRVRPGRRATELWIRLASDGFFRWNAEGSETHRRGVVIEPAQEGTEIFLLCPQGAPVEIHLSAVTYGFPELSGDSVEPRPSWLIPSRRLPDRTIVERSLEL